MMNRNRYLLCLLVIGVMLYYAVPRISVLNTGTEGIFAVTWLIFALFAVAGNLTALLHTPKKGRRVSGQSEGKKRVRSY